MLLKIASSHFSFLAFLAFVIAGLMSCTGEQVTDSNFRSRILPGGLRRPANDSADGTETPPPAHTSDTWVFSWTHNPLALKSPVEYVTGQIAYSQNCIKKFVGHPGDVAGCEGNNMASGPGIYTCDNPFTSHDYGPFVVAIKVLAGKSSVALATGRFTPPPASPGLDRSIYANAAFDGIVYDFRSMDFGGRALVLRGNAIADVSQSYSVAVNPTQPMKFSAHASYACTESTSVSEVLTNWADQMEFMSLTFNTYHDPADKAFFDNGKLDDAGVAAAVASDAVAMTDGDLKIKLASLKKKYSEVKDSMDEASCRESETNSDRSCLSKRIFDSLLDDHGTPSHPTSAWNVSTLGNVLVDLKVVTPLSLKGLKTAQALLQVVVKDFSKRPLSMTRALEAYGCMLSVKHQLEPGDFSHWGEDPQ
jgi:hypothetical protein